MIGSKEQIVKREYPEYPIVGVAAVIFLKQKVLLVRRSQEPGMGQWSLPGGAREVGENLVAAVKREVWEEVSVHVNIGGLVDVFDRIVHDRQGRVQYHYVLLNYWGWVISGHPKAGSDASEVCLLLPEELRTFAVSNAVKEIIWKAAQIYSRTRSANG